MIFKVPFSANYLEEELVGTGLKEGLMSLFSKMSMFQSTVCDNMLGDKELLDHLKGYDLIISDVAMLCAVLVADSLDIKRVDLCPAAPNIPLLQYHQLPMPVSYVPNLMLGFNDKMSFLQRVANFVFYVVGGFFQDAVIASPFNEFKKKYDIKPEKTFQQAVGEAELVLITADFALEYPQPLLPGL